MGQAADPWELEHIDGLWRRLVTFGFRLLYNEMAWSYDLVSWLASLGQWRSWQKAALPFLAGSKILEVAHGPGHMLLELNRTGHQVYGLDFSWSMLIMTRNRMQRSGTQIPLARGIAQAMPFSSNSFHSILVTFPAAFILEKATIVSLYRILSPKGRLVMVPMARFIGNNALIRLVEWLYRITGQRPESDALFHQAWLNYSRPFEEVGFDVKLEEVDLERSRVTVVTAIKPE